MRERWRARARNAVRRYPVLQQMETELRTGSITPTYNGMPHSTQATRKTEILALRELSPNDRRDLEAVRKALQRLKRYKKNYDLRLQIIDIVYWKQTHTIEGAALLIHVSQDTARLWDRDFINMVDDYRNI